MVSPDLGRVASSIGVHIYGGLSFPSDDPADLENLTEAEQARLAVAERLREVGIGYSDLQSTRPQTLRTR